MTSLRSLSFSRVPARRRVSALCSDGVFADSDRSLFMGFAPFDSTKSNSIHRRVRTSHRCAARLMKHRSSTISGEPCDKGLENDLSKAVVLEVVNPLGGCKLVVFSLRGHRFFSFFFSTLLGTSPVLRKPADAKKSLNILLTRQKLAGFCSANHKTPASELFGQDCLRKSCLFASNPQIERDRAKTEKVSVVHQVRMRLPSHFFPFFFSKRISPSTTSSVRSVPRSHPSSLAMAMGMTTARLLPTCTTLDLSTMSHILTRKERCDQPHSRRFS